MLLQALTSYYDRLEASGADDLPAYGFSTENISFCIVLEADGTLHGVEDLRLTDGRKPRPRKIIVPNRGDRSSGIKANFLWDNSGYVLGADGKGNPERTGETFHAFLQLHRAVAHLVRADGVYAAVVRFLESWDPTKATELATWAEVCDRNLVFRIRGQTQYVHEIGMVREAWRAFREREADTTIGQCLVTGQIGPIARLHDKVSLGADQAAIVSFNQDAFESYGKVQSVNAPVSTLAAFKYTTALARLLADRKHSVGLADDRVVFWTDRPDPAEEFFGPVLAGVPPEDEALRDRLRAFLARLRQGRPDAVDVGPPRFFVVGLSPNKARLSVRFWYEGNVDELGSRLADHLRDLEVDAQGGLPLTIRSLVAETARDPKDAPPLLSGALLRSILTGAPYPDGLYGAVLRRIRVDGHVNQARASILKGYLVRKARRSRLQMEVPVSLDPNHPDPAYQLGRLFAALEKIQKDALGQSLNATIKDRFFGAASATPGSVFPRLIKLSQHHIAKLENPAWRVAHEKRLGEIIDHVARFPAHLTLDQQGLFAIAYYHQTRALYQPAPSPVADNN